MYTPKILMWISSEIIYNDRSILSINVFISISLLLLILLSIADNYLLQSELLCYKSQFLVHYLMKSMAANKNSKYQINIIKIIYMYILIPTRREF